MKPSPWCAPVHDCPTSQSPEKPRCQTRETRRALYATSGGSRMAVNVDTSWNHCARSCQQSKRRRAPCMLRTHHRRRCLAGAMLRFWITRRPAPLGSRVARSASTFQSAGPGLDGAPLQSLAPPWPNGSSSSLSTSPRRRKGSSSLLLSTETFLYASCRTSSFHLSSRRANMVEQSSVQHCHLRRLAPSHFAQR